MERLRGNSLLVIGNGFDLACGLNSRYTDFFENYRKNTRFSIENIPADINKYMNIVTSERLYQFDVNDQIRVTFWDYYFDSLKLSNKNLSWYQIEENIRNIFTPSSKRCNLYSAIGSKPIVNDFPSSGDLIKFAKTQLEKIKCIEIALKERFEQEKKELSNKFEKRINKIKMEKNSDLNNSIKVLYESLNETREAILNENYKFVMNELITEDFTDNELPNQLNQANDWVSFLLIELKLFEKAFGRYMDIQLKSLEKKDEYYKKARSLFSDFRKISKIGMIESFNYSEPSLEVPIRHINGDCSTPIFGIDLPTKGKKLSNNKKLSNEEKLFDDKILFKLLSPFTKTSRRIELQFLGKYDSYREDFDNLIVYEHSLNKQDLNYFFPIFDYLRISDATATSKIVFCYSIYKINGETEEEARYRIRKETQNGIKRLIFAYDLYIHPDRKQEMRLLDSITTTGRMEIREIKLPEEKTIMKSQQPLNQQISNSYEPGFKPTNNVFENTQSSLSTKADTSTQLLLNK